MIWWNACELELLDADESPGDGWAQIAFDRADLADKAGWFYRGNDRAFATAVKEYLSGGMHND